MCKLLAITIKVQEGIFFGSLKNFAVKWQVKDNENKVSEIQGMAILNDLTILSGNSALM